MQEKELLLDALVNDGTIETRWFSNLDKDRRYSYVQIVENFSQIQAYKPTFLKLF